MKIDKLREAATAAKTLHDGNRAQRDAWKTEFDALFPQFQALVASQGRAAACASPIRKRMNVLKALGRHNAKPIRAAYKAMRAERDRIIEAAIAEDGPVPPGQEEARRQRLLDSVAISVKEGRTELDKTAHERKPGR